MSHPAQTIVIRDGRARRFVDRWLGARVLDCLVDGPDACERHCAALSQQREPRADLEAGWLVDLDQRLILLLGDPSTTYVGEEASERLAPNRESWQAAVLPNWPGYRVEWIAEANAFEQHLLRRSITIALVDEDVERLEDRLARLRVEVRAREPAPREADAVELPRPAPAPPRSTSKVPILPLLILILPFALLVRLVTWPVRGWLLERARRRQRAARAQQLEEAIAATEAHLGRAPQPPSVPARSRAARRTLLLPLWWSFLLLAGLFPDD